MTDLPDITQYAILDVTLHTGHRLGFDFPTRDEADAVYDELVAAMRASVTIYGAGAEAAVAAANNHQRHLVREAKSNVVQFRAVSGKMAIRPEAVMSVRVLDETDNVNIYAVNFARDALIKKARTAMAAAHGLTLGGVDEYGEPKAG